MAFTGNEPHSISLTVASNMTKNYRDVAATGATIAHYFGKDIIQSILGQEDCVGMRIYYALDENGKKQLVLTGVDASGDDLCDGILGDRSICCPTVCSSANPLNTYIPPA